MTIKNGLLFILAGIMLVSCAAPFSGSNQPVTSPTENSTGAATNPPPTEPVQEPSPTGVIEPTIAPTPAPFVPFEVEMMVNNANVRANPGYLFNVVKSVSQGTKFNVIGKAPGGEWFFVGSDNGTQGWVFGQLLKTENDLKSVPVLMPTDVQILEGRIMNEEGKPISGIQFAFVQTVNDVLSRNDGVSDENGVFLVFMPPAATGDWTVSYTAIACTSNTMDADCNCINSICGTVDPSVQTLTLPQKEPVLFTWRYAR